MRLPIPSVQVLRVGTATFGRGLAIPLVALLFSALLPRPGGYAVRARCFTLPGRAVVLFAWFLAWAFGVGVHLEVYEANGA